MNDFDDLLRNAWQAARPSTDSAALIQRVRRHRLRLRLRRSLEIALTLGAVVMLLRPLAGAAVTPAYWLVMPFFAVYMPAAWWLLLRAPQARGDAATLDVATYAQVRLSQLRAGLRELRIARVTAVVLLVYALAAMAVTTVMDAVAWQSAAGDLLIYAGACAVLTYGISYTRCRRYRAEYRGMRRLAGPR
ncbi:hypothetical protein ACF3M1_12925 [Luteimonas sp. WGS1318]|uniref:hypothetical protein n=1 Tax=Luteimonas sp. WGS1318 TaxID=3366815 RepID=UPI00372D7685